MPNRLIKESICTSDDIDQLTMFQEIFFYRLIVNCDDYGRMDARPAILKSRLFPLKDVSFSEIEDALSALDAIGLISLYIVCGKPYLYLKSWGKHQQIRASKSKYPKPDDGEEYHLISNDIKSNHVQSNVPVIQSNPTRNTNPNPKENPTPPKGGMGGNEISPGVVDDLSDLDEVVANVEKKKPRKQEKKNQFERVLDENGIIGELRTAYLDFVDMRSKIKKPMTDRALKILIDKTKKLAEDENTQIAILHQSIEHDWQTVYELKNDMGFKRKINSPEDVKKAFGSFHSVFDDIPDDFSGTFDDTVRKTEKENAVTGEGTVA